MSDALECPLLHQLSSLQVQPLQAYALQDTFIHPDDHINVTDDTLETLLQDDGETESQGCSRTNKNIIVSACLY